MPNSALISAKKRIVKSIQHTTPAWAKKLVPQAVKDGMLGTTIIDLKRLRPTMDYLNKLMLRYQTKDLVNENPDVFRRRIEDFLEMIDAAMEGYADPSIQRDLSIKFHWANDHDFGTFFVPGKLTNRHISLMATLIDWFPVLQKDLSGKRILDIGCWSGGTSLLLCAMGAQVVGVEEVKKYIDCMLYMKKAFAIDKLDPRNLSLYECTADDLQHSFDYILFAGVLYHVTDPVLALRIAYNCLKDGGECIVETAVSGSDDYTLAYEGPRVTLDGSRESLSRSGWNWFLPSPIVLKQMMADVGFVNIKLSPVLDSSRGHRIYAAGTRDQHRDMTRAGLSVRHVR